MARKNPRWVNRLVIETVHFDLLSAHGGMPGLRDESVLESAIARPRQKRAYDTDADIADLAAAYGFGLARSHPFNDGNKRVAFVVMAVFLGLNGYDIEAPESEVVTIMLDLAVGEITEEALADWLRARITAS